MKDHLSVIRKTGGPELPALIAGAGKRAAWRFIEFFTVNARNPNTRAAYGRAAGAFLRWCEGQGIASLADVRPVHVAAYVEHLGREFSPPSVKQHLACILMLFAGGAHMAQSAMCAIKRSSPLKFDLWAISESRTHPKCRDICATRDTIRPSAHL